MPVSGSLFFFFSFLIPITSRCGLLSIVSSLWKKLSGPSPEASALFWQSPSLPSSLPGHFNKKAGKFFLLRQSYCFERGIYFFARTHASIIGIKLKWRSESKGTNINSNPNGGSQKKYIPSGKRILNYFLFNNCSVFV